MLSSAEEVRQLRMKVELQTQNFTLKFVVSERTNEDRSNQRTASASFIIDSSTFSTTAHPSTSGTNFSTNSPTTYHTTEETKSRKEVGIVIGASVGAIVFVVLVIAVVVIAKKRRNESYGEAVQMNKMK